jgi:hypothetical protein
MLVYGAESSRCTVYCTSHTFQLNVSTSFHVMVVAVSTSWTDGDRPFLNIHNEHINMSLVETTTGSVAQW